MYSEEAHNKSSSEYILYGNLIEFISLDQPQKVRGRKRDLLFINEANELFWEDWQQLLFRTQEKVILDYNPSDEYHWIYDKVIPREDCAFFRTTYLDNPFLGDSIKQEIERLKETDEQYWQIYGLGIKGITKSTIFRYIEVNEVPEQAKFLSYGMDFGYTNDPTTLIGIWIDGYNLYAKEYLYRTMMTTTDINKFLTGLNIERELIWADSAEVRLIDELRRMGWNIRPSIKGRDSVNAGIDLLKRYKIHLTKESNNAIQEFRNYKWQEDRNGKMINKPIDSHNHLVDALRYGTYSILSKPNFGKYAIN
jgi:phage terminase large subunit